MKLPVVVAATVFSLFIGALSAHAEDQKTEEAVDYGRLSPYISLGAAWDWRNSAAGGSTAGLNSRLGFRFWKYLAAEFEYELQGKGPNGNVFGGNLKAFPMAGPIQPFLLLGGAYWELNNARKNGPGVRLGGGVDAYVTEHVYLTAGIEYVWGIDDIDPYNFATAYVGAGFRL